MKQMTITSPDKEIQSEKWNTILNGTAEKDTVVLDYLTDQIQFRFLKEENYSKEQILHAVSVVVSYLQETSTTQICAILKNSSSLQEIKTSNVPQYSNFASAAICVPQLLCDAQKPLSNIELGYSLYADTKSDGAAEKYGENHGKLAVQLDLAEKKKENNHAVYYPSALSSLFYQMDDDIRFELLVRLCYRIPIIQNAVVDNEPIQVVDEWLQKLFSKNTMERRRKNVLDLLAVALEE